MNWTTLRTTLRDGWHATTELLGAGPLHRQRLDGLDIRISVSGVRGKSTTVRRLHDILVRRGHDTLAKTTGTEAMTIHNGTEWEIERSGRVMLYENERVIRKVDPEDAIVVENQGIREYTTRLVNEQYVDPHVVFITNVRADHLDTLGNDRRDIAQSLARSVPPGTHVVSGEQNPDLQSYVEAELERRDATVTHVQIPEEHRGIPGVECIYGLDDVLRVVGEAPLAQDRLDDLVESMVPTWNHLPGGRVYNAADVNDVQSTELVRRNLTRNEPVQPLLYLRADRRGRTVSFCRYLDWLADRDQIQQARVAGENTALFRRRTSVPVIEHEPHPDNATETLDAALEDDYPVVLMGNTQSPFMQTLFEVIEERTLTRSREVA